MYPHRSSHQHTLLDFFKVVSCVLTSPFTSIFRIYTAALKIISHWSFFVMPRASGSLHHPSVRFSLSQSTISTGLLHTLLHFHIRPIKLVVCQRSYFLQGMGYLVLRWASHLDAFSGSPIQSSLPGYATGVTTGTRALRPSRSSRTRDSSSQTPNAHSG